MKLYALHDKKAQWLSSFHCERSDAQASRGFADAVNAKDSVFAKYPEDFELVCLGEVEESTKLDVDDLYVSTRARTGKLFEVVLSAEMVVSLRPRQDAQLSLMGESLNG